MNNEINNVAANTTEGPTLPARKKRKKSTGKIFTLAEEADISFELDEGKTEPDNSVNQPISAINQGQVGNEILDSLPEEQSGKITF